MYYLCKNLKTTKKTMDLIHITVSEELRAAAPEYRGVALLAKVENSKESAGLWEMIEKLEAEIKSGYTISEVNKRKEILATRQAYKALGKDPNRYRPSAEALCRRVLKDMPLYRISVLVDLINYISIKYGYSIGGFDGDEVVGDLELGVGRNGELFRAIGRGELNIEGLPVYRDEAGPIGTPTSDEERTMLRDSTSNLLMIVNGYDGGENMDACVNESIMLLKKFAGLKSFNVIKIA